MTDAMSNYTQKFLEDSAVMLGKEGRHDIANALRDFAAIRRRQGEPAERATSDDTARIDWLALRPRAATINIDGKPTNCVFWGVAGDPEVTFREAIDVARRVRG